MKNKRLQNKGITLIALVITVIILLILAGVAIATLTGPNGIITNALKAKNNTEMAEIKETAELVKQEMLINAKGDNVERNDLVEKITNKLDGIQEEYSSIVKDGKYVVKVDENLKISVEEYTGKYLEDGELGIILTYTPIENEVEAVKINIEVRIGGMQTYEYYAQEILKNKTQEEKEQYFIEYNSTYMEIYYPEYEVNLENILKYWYNNNYETLEELYTAYGYETLEEYLIALKMVERDAFPNANIVVTLPDGTTSNRSLLYPTTSYTVYNNETYTIKAVYEDQTKDESIEITNIKDKITYDLPQEDQNTYTISYVEDLVGLSLNVNNGINSYKGKTIKLLNNIDFSDDNSYKNPNDTSLGDINNDGKVESIKTEVTTGKGFTPIGLGYKYDSVNQISITKYFYGIFDGNNKTISNLYIQNNEVNDETSEYIGLFGYILGAEIKNLNVEGNINVDKSLKNQGTVYIGGIVADSVNGKIEGCNSYVNITLSTNCQSYTGGIAGYNGNSRLVKYCNNYGNIVTHYGKTVMDVYTGGIAGYNWGTISLCNNYSDVKMSSDIDATAERPYIGGICGYNSKAIEKCSNSGNISNVGKGMYIYVAGIAGMNCYSGSDVYINQCFNSGTILNEGETIDEKEGSCQAGGIAASNTGSGGATVRNSYNTGTIINNAKNNLFIGGIASFNASKSKVINSYNVGNLLYDKELKYGGAVVGNDYGKTIQNCYYLQGVYPQGTGRGEIGTTVKTESQMKTQEFVTALQGEETETIWKIVEGQNEGYPILNWQK